MENRRINMNPANRSILPKIPAAISACLRKPPGNGKVVIRIHKLRKDTPSCDLQCTKDKNDKFRKEIPRKFFYLFLRHIQYFTFTKHNPLAGTVGPASFLFLANNIFLKLPFGDLFLPISISVPTIFLAI